MKQNLGDNSVAVNSLGKDLQLSYFSEQRQYGARGSTGAFVKTARVFDPEYLKTPDPTAKSHTGVYFRLESQRFLGFLYPTIQDVHLACLLEQS